jgi:hypothetical protein
MRRPIPGQLLLAVDGQAEAIADEILADLAQLADAWREYRWRWVIAP